MRVHSCRIQLTSGLTNYGDEKFSLFLRKAFIKGAGYSDDALDRTIIGVINTGVSYSFVHPGGLISERVQPMPC